VGRRRDERGELVVDVDVGGWAEAEEARKR
jgi:hypothetical protein